MAEPPPDRPDLQYRINRLIRQNRASAHYTPELEALLKVLKHESRIVGRSERGVRMTLKETKTRNSTARKEMRRE